MNGRNENIPLTRRYPVLSKKQAARDAKVARQLIHAWDDEHNAENVFDIFRKEAKWLSSERYWEVLKSVWIVCGGMNNVEQFKELFASRRPQRHYFMSPEDTAVLNSLPDIIPVYRACDIPDNGISWTLNREYAAWYRQMYAKTTLREASVLKSAIFAYIDRNGEREVLILNYPYDGDERI